MGAVRFLPSNTWLTATIEASSAVAGLPPAASQNPDRTYAWRSLTGTDDQWLRAAMDAPITASMVAVANLHRLQGGTVQLASAGTLSGPWTVRATLPAADPISNVSVAFFPPVTAQYWQLMFAYGAEDSGGYAEAGYVGLGNYYQPSRIMGAGYDVSVNDPSILTQSVDGQVSAAVRSTYTTVDLRFVALVRTDLDQIHAMLRAVAIRLPIFAVLDVDIPWQWYLGRLTSPLKRTPRQGPGSPQFEVAVGFEEAR